MTTGRSTRFLVAAGGTAALLGGLVGPAAAEEASPDGVTAKTPLVDYVGQVHDFPGPNGDKYRFATTTTYWSVVAVEMLNGDVDLELYDDKGMTQLLDESRLGGTETDFVAVDSNRRDHGKYFPEVNTFLGDGAYVVELAQGDDNLTRAETIPVTVRDVVVVRDTFLTAGTPYVFTVTPTSSVDPDLFLMSSNPRDEATWVQPRNSAVRLATMQPAGVAETFSFTPVLSQWYGVVVTMNGGDGSMVLSRGAP